MSGGRKSGPTVPEHRRRERGQALIRWRTTLELADALRERARELGLTISEALARAVRKDLEG